MLRGEGKLPQAESQLARASEIVRKEKEPDYDQFILKPYDPRLMGCYPVSTRINHVANDDEDCSRSEVGVNIERELFRGLLFHTRVQ